MTITVVIFGIVFFFNCYLLCTRIWRVVRPRHLTFDQCTFVHQKQLSFLLSTHTHCDIAHTNFVFAFSFFEPAANREKKKSKNGKRQREPC
ncbi:hypothetical protein ACQKWADRAFT_295244 [Trichoderma austrokoningii]